MSLIRRKSTTHDLATLRLHPDGSRVQQSAENVKRRTAGSTIVDSRGNWIAKDAGGKSSIKKRRKIRMNDSGAEFIDIAGDEQSEEDDPEHIKGKQRACDSQPNEESHQEPQQERLGTRAGKRFAFMNDLSFLEPASISSSSDQDTMVSFPDPDPDLLKSIHHFTSCYYREKGQLLDSTRSYRGEKKERHNKSGENIHTLAFNNFKQRDTDSETEGTETASETSEEDEGEGDVVNAEDNETEGPRTKADAYRKDMYKAFDGSALMAIGIVLQEYVAYSLTPRPSTSNDPGSQGGSC